MKLFVPGGGERILPHLRAVPGVDEVITSQISPTAASNFLADRSYLLPRFDDPAFLDGVEQLYERERFDAWISAHDPVLLVVARNWERLSRLDCRFAQSPPDTVELAADKLALARFFLREGIPTPPTVTLDEFATRPTFPAFLKPRHTMGRDFGMSLFRRLENGADLEAALTLVGDRVGEFIVQDFLEGDEINVDFFCDAAGRVKSVVPLHRHAMTAKRAIAHGTIITDPAILEAVRPLVERLAAATPIWGPSQLQLYRLPSGEIRCTEINARLSGSSTLVRAAGVDYFHYLVRLLRGETFEIRETARPLSMIAGESVTFFEGSPARPLPQ